MSSLTDVFLRHYREVLGFLAMRTGSRDVAQDCAQDTWIKLAEFQDKTLPDNDRAYVEEKRDKSGETAEINPGHRGMGRDLSGWNCKSLTESGRVI